MLDFRIEEDFDNEPLGADLEPVDRALSCVDEGDGSVVDLTLIPEIASAQFSGTIRLVTPEEYEQINPVMLAIAEGNGSSQPQQNIDAYLAFANSMINSLHQDCLNTLTADGLCSDASAEEACQAFVRRPAFVHYTHLDLGSDYVRPTRLPVCGQSFDTDDGTSMTSGDDTSPATTSGGGGGDDGSSSDGADSTGSEIAPPPFGDLDELVHCNRASTACTYDPELVELIYAGLDTLSEEEFWPRLTKKGDPAYPGVVLEGLDPGEYSHDLVGAFGLEPGDIVRTINGHTMKSPAEVNAAMAEFSNTGIVELEYDRGLRSKSVTIRPR